MPGNPFASRIDLEPQRSLQAIPTKDDDYRPELKQTTPFELSLILVKDVSRWGSISLRDSALTGSGNNANRLPVGQLWTCSRGLSTGLRKNFV